MFFSDLNVRYFFPAEYKEIILCGLILSEMFQSHHLLTDLCCDFVPYSVDDDEVCSVSFFFFFVNHLVLLFYSFPITPLPFMMYFIFTRILCIF